MVSVLVGVFTLANESITSVPVFETILVNTDLCLLNLSYRIMNSLIGAGSKLTNSLLFPCQMCIVAIGHVVVENRYLILIWVSRSEGF